MSTSAPPFTPAEWENLIDKFLESGLTQSAFCQAENLSRYRFAYHYRRSDKFAGQRRNRIHTDKMNEQKESGFRTVKQKTVSSAHSPCTESVNIDIGDKAIRLHCSATLGIEAIVRLMREAQS